jgi:hypothetical protein
MQSYVYVVVKEVVRIIQGMCAWTTPDHILLHNQHSGSTVVDRAQSPKREWQRERENVLGVMSIVGNLKSNSVMRLATATVETSSDYC